MDEIPWTKVLARWLDKGQNRSWYSPEELRAMRSAAETAFGDWLRLKVDATGCVNFGGILVYVDEYEVLVYVANGDLVVAPIIGKIPMTIA